MNIFISSNKDLKTGDSNVENDMVANITSAAIEKYMR